MVYKSNDDGKIETTVWASNVMFKQIVNAIKTWRVKAQTIPTATHRTARATGSIHNLTGSLTKSPKGIHLNSDQKTDKAYITTDRRDGSDEYEFLRHLTVWKWTMDSK